MIPSDPPLYYVLSTDGTAQAGYFDRGTGRFFRWRDVRFDPRKVPAPLVGGRIDPHLVLRTIDIDAPIHRNRFKEYLAATLRAD